MTVINFATSTFEEVYRIAKNNSGWWTKLRKVAYFIKCVNFWRSKAKHTKCVTRSNPPLPPLSLTLDHQDYDQAKKLVFLSIQREHFADEFQHLIKRFLAHIFGSAGSSLVTSFVIRHLADRVRSMFPPNVIETLLKRFYVDDGHGGEDNLEAAIVLRKNLAAALNLGGFSLGKWKGNHPLLAADPDTPVDEIPPLEDKYIKVLGVQWNPSTDMFRFQMDISKIKLPATTPRQLVSIQSSLYDPLGWVSPFGLCGRRLLQHSMQNMRGWDSPLPADVQSQFMAWVYTIPLLQRYPIPRWWNTDETIGAEDISLHIFADASKIGYGAIVYRRAVSRTGVIAVSFICSGSHVVPNNAARASHDGSTPPLEMVAAAKAVEKRLFVERSVGKFNKVYHWSDSFSVIKQIRDTTTRFKIFFANRLSKIHAASAVLEWRFVDGTSNPANFCSRGLEAGETAKWRLFHDGPTFLSKPKSQWPKEPHKRLSTNETSQLTHCK